MSRRCDELEPLHSAWVDGELRTGERARLAAHLQHCPRCRAAIAELRVTSSMLRSLPVRALPAGVAEGIAPGKADRRLTGAGVRRALVRSTAAAVFVTATLGAAAFAVGASAPDERQVAVPVDVFVADHLVRAVGGPVSTPALLETRP